MNNKTSVSGIFETGYWYGGLSVIQSLALPCKNSRLPVEVEDTSQAPDKSNYTLQSYSLGFPSCAPLLKCSCD